MHYSPRHNFSFIGNLISIRARRECLDEGTCFWDVPLAGYKWFRGRKFFDVLPKGKMLHPYMVPMKEALFSSVCTYSSCLACVCICRYLSPNCLLFDQSLIKETITLGTGQGKASSDKNVVEQHWERKKKVWCFLIMWTLWLWPQLVIWFSSVQFSFQHSFWEINYFVCLHRTTFVINILWDPGATSMI